MPAGLSPKEQRAAAGNIAAAQAVARLNQLPSLGVSQTPTPAGPVPIPDDEAALAAQARLQEQQAKARLVQQQMMAEEDDARQQEQQQKTASLSSTAETAARQKIKGAQLDIEAKEKAIEWAKTKAADFFETILDLIDLGDLGITSIISFFAAILRFLRTALIKGSSGFIGMLAFVVPKYAWFQMFFSWVIIILTLVIIAFMLLMAAYVLLAFYSIYQSIGNYVPDIFMNLVKSYLNIPFDIPTPD